ncbi:RagB/SusD family nutrient uptake outer membrane protein [Flexithrix dorotheae]|uniref:RagB/SusD family nutrient uptake outer membrane protein n=1 Tax=Flexithrix dorotheae TaxID=70993 RepID=UPI00037ED4EF|nr:RagB/SusD family nutrient uptake outer membrane protein [Flexithrix dorotheae]
MNNIKIYLISCICFGLLAGCNDEFLDLNPKTQINDDIFWNNASDLKTYNNQLYAQYFNSKGFGRGGFNAGILTDDNLSDNAFVQNPGDVRLGIHSVNQPGRSNWNWALIRNINQMLENSEAADIDASIKNKYIAEARLLRALDYYDKVKLYGRLPLVDHVLSEDDELLYQPQATRDEILAFIKADLEFAVEWMETEAEVNRFDKYVAMAYMARIMLHEGTFRKYHGLGDETSYLEEAKLAAENVINSGRYLIDDSKSYNALFANINLKGNQEVVFFRDYGDEFQLYHNVSNILTHVDGAQFSGAKSLIEDYLCTDGLSIEESALYLGDDNLSNEFANRDLRLSNTFALPNTYFIGEKLYLNSSPISIVETASPSGYQIVKFFNEEQDIQAWDRAFIDAPLIRYAEVLLIYAEAKAELGSISQTDVDNTINLLRSKAGVAEMTLDQGTVIREIRRERRVELAFEGFRYDDLMRWKEGSKLAEPVLGLKFNDEDIADANSYEIGQDIYLNDEGYIFSNNVYSFDEAKNYYFPIPINEISLNPNLVQTPNWD